MAQEEGQPKEVVLSSNDREEDDQQDAQEDTSQGGIRPFSNATPPQEAPSPAIDDKLEENDPFPLCAMNRNSTLFEPNHKGNKTEKAKAAIVILVRNSELGAMRRTLREFEE